MEKEQEKEMETESEWERETGRVGGNCDKCQPFPDTSKYTPSRDEWRFVTQLGIKITYRSNAFTYMQGNE